jgi:hypothetical protein
MLEVADCNTGTFIEVRNRTESYDRSEIEVLQFPCEGKDAYNAQKYNQNDGSEIDVLQFPCKEDNAYDTEKKCDQNKQKAFLPYVMCNQNKEKVFLPYVIATSRQSSVAYDPRPPTNRDG